VGRVNGDGNFSIGEVRLPCYDLALTDGRSEPSESAPAKYDATFFAIQLTGAEWYDLLRLFRCLVAAQGEPGRKRTLVLWAEKISAQLCAQGW